MDTNGFAGVGFRFPLARGSQSVLP